MHSDDDLHAVASQANLAWIESFLAVVDECGFGAAASKLHRSQSRVSAHIADLEGWLGAVLFDRHVRPVALTEAGNEFVPYARRCLDNLSDAVRRIKSVERGLEARISVGTYPSAGAFVVPVALKSYLLVYPHARIELVEAAVHGLDEALLSRRVSLAIRPELPEPDPALQGFLFWSERMKLVVALDHPLASCTDAVPVSDISGLPLIITGAYLEHEAEAFEMLRIQGLTPKVAFFSDQPQSLVGLAAEGLGVGFTNELALLSLRLDSVKVIDIELPLMRRAGVYWNSAVDAEPAVVALRDIFLSCPLPDVVHRISPPIPVP